MARNLILLVLTYLLLHFCSKANAVNLNIGTSQVKADTVIGSKIITDEIPGLAYRKRAKSYFLIIKNDTSEFACFVSELKTGGVYIFLDIPYQKQKLVHRERMAELKLLLPEAAKDFNFDSVQSLNMGRLILSGDLGIEVTNQYRKEFGKGTAIKDFEKVISFLSESKLTTELNQLLEPYSVAVAYISPEKLFLTLKKNCFGQVKQKPIRRKYLTGSWTL